MPTPKEKDSVPVEPVKPDVVKDQPEGVVVEETLESVKAERKALKEQAESLRKEVDDARQEHAKREKDLEDKIKSKNAEILEHQEIVKITNASLRLALDDQKKFDDKWKKAKKDCAERIKSWAELPEDRLDFESLATEFNNLFERYQQVERQRAVDYDLIETKVADRTKAEKEASDAAKDKEKKTKEKLDGDIEAATKKIADSEKKLKKFQDDIDALFKNHAAQSAKLIKILTTILKRPARILEIWGDDVHSDLKKVYAEIGGDTSALPPPSKDKADAKKV